MDISHAGKENVELTLNHEEVECLLKILRYTLKELTDEYSTRTGFYEDETASLINIISGSEGNQAEISKIQISNEQLLNLRQNLVEILCAMNIESHDNIFGQSKNVINLFFELIDKFGKGHKQWQ
jgi:hypothetical protein